jgi:sialic acid synthase SpsE
MVKSCELTYNELALLFEFANQKGITLFSTAESLNDIHFLKERDVPAIKIASMDLNYQAFIQRAASLQVPIIISTGMGYTHEVANAIYWVEKTGNTQIAILHCVSCYPTPPDQANLAAVQTLKNTFAYPIGYSDHTIGLEVAMASIGLGACVLEKHYTVNKKLPGPDHACSADPQDLKTLVSFARMLHVAKGDGFKKPSPCENETRLRKRRSIYTAKKLEAGHILSEADVVFLTPSHPDSQLEDMNAFMGRVTKENLKPKTLITRGMLKES